MLGYSAGVTVFLAYLGLSGAATGVLLWPATVLHLVLTVLLARNGLRYTRPDPAVPN